MDIKDLLCSKPQQQGTNQTFSKNTDDQRSLGPSANMVEVTSDISSPEAFTPPPRLNARQHIQTRVPWRPEEDHLLRQGYEQGLSWTLISARYLPHRSRGCCWGRFKTLQSMEVHRKEWSEKEDDLLRLAVKKHAKLFKQVWRAVAADIGDDRSWRDCRQRAQKINIQD
ncbi:hypothetical protein INT43_006143 [Umbelopsis isabellina]|uniref:Myb-like domain-containing protein n=1 Tax=Mortierella isabellina TaxID=91625 RepID=A0A8H7Q0J2_MORIS|nr:hypothetical protein INT43_006143 [Umbelopsis isabellina]